MQAREKDVERAVAKQFNKWFAKYGLSEIERIPAPGRTGPDMTWNELQLVLDPKSWKAHPKNHIITRPAVYDHGSYYTVRLADLDLLFSSSDHDNFEVRPMSLTVWKLWEHLDEWRQEKLPEGITGIVLHWPSTWIKYSVLVLGRNDLSRLYQRFIEQTNKS